MNEYKMNKLLLAGDKLILEMQLRESWVIFSACGSFTKNKERIKIFKEIRDSRHIYENQIDKICFQHKMAYGYFKDLPRTTAADKILYNKAFNITKNLKYDEYQRGLALMVHKSFDKKPSTTEVKSENMLNQELAEELHKPIKINFEKQKVHSYFIVKTWGCWSCQYVMNK